MEQSVKIGHCYIVIICETISVTTIPRQDQFLSAKKGCLFLLKTANVALLATIDLSTKT